MIESSIKILEDLHHPTGLFSASNKNVTTGYDLSWIRDTVYASIGFEAVEDRKKLVSTYHGLLNIFLKHEEKIDWMIKEPHPKVRFRYIHARYHPETLEERHEEWGNKQNDSIGAVLFKIGQLEEKGIKIIRNKSDLNILQKLVYYLEAIEYWQDEDNGMWEENEEVHASSVGACVAGLKQISKLVEVDKNLIKKGQDVLNELLPRESITKEVDLALLSLIYPYNVVSAKQREQILENIEKQLVRKNGVIRYIDDQYYNKKGEAEWCFGFPWLAIIYKQLNKPNKYLHYMRKTLQVMNDRGEIPELYYANSQKYNENSPLGWGQALCIAAAT